MNDRYRHTITIELEISRVPSLTSKDKLFKEDKKLSVGASVSALYSVQVCTTLTVAHGQDFVSLHDGVCQAYHVVCEQPALLENQSDDCCWILAVCA